MTRVVYYTASSLNGLLADENNSLDWLFSVEQDADHNEADFSGFLAGIGVLVEGSTTYQWVLEHEGLLEYPERWQQFYGNRATFVFTSRTLPAVEAADIRFVSGGVAEVYPELIRAARDGDIWIIGGGDIAGQFADAGLLDEIQVTFAPAFLTGGAPLLPRRIDPDRLRLRSVEQRGQFAHLILDVVKAEVPRP
ncbi:dihydrofolate reductase family protein [Marisediminicola antarctica]|uniref:Deaminase n=1 Tax=Marisediminicola antarctica TaxID=674079 RepID=A0A7L5AE17_9MICO|nr:dihydrofolate reductase family protein [Marisediminicola antarctica]QHO68470.1 deaminase [Marisediminicola antarctica]